MRQLAGENYGPVADSLLDYHHKLATHVRVRVSLHRPFPPIAGWLWLFLLSNSPHASPAASNMLDRRRQKNGRTSQGRWKIEFSKLSVKPTDSPIDPSIDRPQKEGGRQTDRERGRETGPVGRLDGVN